jgi:ubiquinone/menaquinone biosynthesis C-methylase UbiE
MKRIYDILEQPWIYRLAQLLLAPGADRTLTRELASLLRSLPSSQRLLDIGCGPRSWLSHVGLHPVGADFSHQYIATFVRDGGPGVVASADWLPFAAGSFDGVWSIGVLHHLSDAQVRQAIDEMLRVCRPGGYVAVLDAVMPRHSLLRPLAALIRRMDRGRYVRQQQQFERLLPDRGRWVVERRPYSLNGLEIVVCWREL